MTYDEMLEEIESYQEKQSVITERLNHVMDVHKAICMLQRGHGFTMNGVKVHLDKDTTEQFTTQIRANLQKEIEKLRDFMYGKRIVELEKRIEALEKEGMK